jgi:acetyltransferase-like isoleucine patch superfamily enzyme
MVKVLPKIYSNFSSIYLLFIRYLPGNVGIVLRRRFYKPKFKYCGEGLIIGVGVLIDGENLISIGDNVVIDSYCVIATSEVLIGEIRERKNKFDVLNKGEIFIGDNVHLVQNCILMGHGGIFINRNSTLSAFSKIYSMSNLAYDPENRGKIVSIMPYSQAIFLLSQVVLEENVWLGLNSVVMPGVCIGKNSFSVTNSVIITSFEENSYLKGNPAKKINKRFNYE